jgi:hypothetical protein
MRLLGYSSLICSYVQKFVREALSWETTPAVNGSTSELLTFSQVIIKSKVAASIPGEVIKFLFTSSRTMTLDLTQSLTGMSTRNLRWSTERPERKVDNLTAICEPIVYKMWEPRRLITL